MKRENRGTAQIFALLKPMSFASETQARSVDLEIRLDGGLGTRRGVAAFRRDERLAALFIFPRLQSAKPLTKPGLFRPLPVLIMVRIRI